MAGSEPASADRLLGSTIVALSAMLANRLALLNDDCVSLVWSAEPLGDMDGLGDTRTAICAAARRTGGSPNGLSRAVVAGRHLEVRHEKGKRFGHLRGHKPAILPSVSRNSSAV
jgi:hypothetical protein